MANIEPTLQSQVYYLKVQQTLQYVCEIHGTLKISEQSLTESEFIWLM